MDFVCLQNCYKYANCPNKIHTFTSQVKTSLVNFENFTESRVTIVAPLHEYQTLSIAPYQSDKKRLQLNFEDNYR